MFQIIPNEAHVVVSVADSNILQPKAIEVSASIYDEARARLGRVKFIDDALIPYDPPPTPAPFPSVVSAAQAKIALFKAGLLDQVKAVVAAHPYEIVRIWYGDANDWERGNPYVQALGAEIGLTAEQMDELFIAASKV